MTYTIGSLFAGIGGIDLAFAWAGYHTAWQVEIDDYCTQILQRHWPDVPRYRDVRGVTGRGGKGWRRYARVTPVDILVGGFPCQDISVAGRGAGIQAGTRSGLWFEFARLIGELRPRVVLLENVSAILARDGTIVIGSLAALGYDCRWGTIRAADAGAPHQRERWFCVAYANDRRHEPQNAWKGNGLREFNGHGKAQERQRHELESRTGEYGESLAHAADTRLPQRRPARQPARAAQAGPGLESEPERRGELANTLHNRREGGQSVREGTGALVPPSRTGARATSQPRLGRNTHGLPGGLDFPGWPAGPGQQQHEWEPPRVVSRQPHRAARLLALGNAVVPQVVYPLAVAIREWLEAQDAGSAGECEGESVAQYTPPRH